MNNLFDRENLKSLLEQQRADKQKIVFTNGCFDILHVGHVDILRRARELGDFLVVGVNSDASVKRLKGESRPIHDQNARAQVLAALKSVDAVVIFDEDTPIETIAALKPDIHVKGGDYTADQLPEAKTVRENGGEIAILPLVEGYSSSNAIEKQRAGKPAPIVMIPARYASTRFPGKPLAILNGEAVICHVVKAAMRSKAARPIVVCTDHPEIQGVIESNFQPAEAVVALTSPDCHTGTDRLAEATISRLGSEISSRQIIVNVQGDEPFIDPAHIDALIAVMESDDNLEMATLATPITNPEQENDPNVVKAVVSDKGRALYFSRSTVPYDREKVGTTRLRHLGIYAYDARWLLKMAALPPSPLEETEKLEQLRALEFGAGIGVAIVNNVVPIAIDTPEDLEKAREYLKD
jgi:3-deoxy-manno-octulosonate cytidylyltransferase (CMP-KDO synthetase)